MSPTSPSSSLTREWLPVLATALCWIASALLYAQLPPFVAPLVGSGAEHDPFSSRGWTAFFPPFLLTVLTGLFLAQPVQSPTAARALALWRLHPVARGALLVMGTCGHLVRLRSASGYPLTDRLSVGVTLVGVILLAVAVMTQPSTLDPDSPR